MFGWFRNRKQARQSTRDVVEKRAAEVHAAASKNERAVTNAIEAIARHDDATEILRGTLKRTLATLADRRTADAETR